jgi:hypothetical protein
MTLSHEPWLVVLYRLLAVRGGRGQYLDGRILDGPQVSRRRQFHNYADLIREVGVRFGRQLGATAAQFSSQPTAGFRDCVRRFPHPVSEGVAMTALSGDKRLKQDPLTRQRK